MTFRPYWGEPLRGMHAGPEVYELILFTCQPPTIYIYLPLSLALSRLNMGAPRFLLLSRQHRTPGRATHCRIFRHPHTRIRFSTRNAPLPT